MADWPIKDSGEVVIKDYITVTAGASAHTKGSWQEIDSSLSIDVTQMFIIPLWAGNVAEHIFFLLDIGVGSSGSEVVVVENIIMGQNGSLGKGVLQPIIFPVAIPSGSRVSARCQATVASEAVSPIIGFFSGDIRPQTVITMGANTATTLGTSIDPGGTSNTYGSWVEIESSTIRNISGLFVAVNASNTDILPARWYLDVAVGSAESEQAVISGYHLFARFNLNEISPKISPIFPVSIPIGSRISCRAKCTITDSTDRVFTVIIYGIS